MSFRLPVRLLLVSLVFVISNAALAQTSSGEISGRIVDSTGAVVVAANVSLTNQATGETRTAKSDTAGNFRFVALQPGMFTIKVEAPKFRQFQKSDLHLSASERLPAGDLKLEIG